MIKEATFCDLCGRHVNTNHTLVLTLVEGMAPTAGTKPFDAATNSDICLCNFCEADIGAIIDSRKQHPPKNEI